MNPTARRLIGGLVWFLVTISFAGSAERNPQVQKAIDRGSRKSMDSKPSDEEIGMPGARACSSTVKAKTAAGMGDIIPAALILVSLSYSWFEPTWPRICR